MDIQTHLECKRSGALSTALSDAITQMSRCRAASVDMDAEWITLAAPIGFHFWPIRSKGILRSQQGGLEAPFLLYTVVRANRLVFSSRWRKIA